jgi:hypothetical protein
MNMRKESGKPLLTPGETFYGTLGFLKFEEECSRP